MPLGAEPGIGAALHDGQHTSAMGMAFAESTNLVCLGRVTHIMATVGLEKPKNQTVLQ